MGTLDPNFQHPCLHFTVSSVHFTMSCPSLHNFMQVNEKLTDIAMLLPSGHSFSTYRPNLFNESVTWRNFLRNNAN